MIGVKRTALSIHSLEKSDQQWILDNLSESNKEKVMIALGYIDKLCLESNSNIVATLSSDDITFFEPGSSSSDTAITMQVDLTPVEIVATVLQSESAKIKQTVLNHRHWSWKKKYLNMEKEAGENYDISDTEITPAVEKCIIESFSDRVINFNMDVSRHE